MLICSVSVTILLQVSPLASWLSLSEPWRTLGYPADAWPAYFDSLGADPAREADIIGTDDILEFRGCVLSPAIHRRRLQAIGVAGK